MDGYLSPVAFPQLVILRLAQVTRDLGDESQEEMMAYDLLSAVCSAELETLGDRIKGLNETTAFDVQPALLVHSLWMLCGV